MAGGRAPPPSAVTALLRLSACIEGDADRLAGLARAGRAIDDWPAVVERAEAHGLAPLLWRHLTGAGVPVPTVAARALRSLVVRHRHEARVRFEVLRDVLDVLDEAGIEHLLLKGAALAHLLYPAPELRPMADLDILVRPAAATRAQDVLERRLGFTATPGSRHATPRFHHHLPAVVLSRDGVPVQIEIHRDAFSGDRPDSLRLDTLTEPARPLALAGRAARALGHVDMLRHLAGHALEPAAELRLLAVVDIVGYAERFSADIDWSRLHHRHPAVVNLLALLHYVSPLPPALARFRPPPDAEPPAGIGEGLPPLRTLASQRVGLLGPLRQLLYPPDWWMRAYYGVPPGRALGRIRWTQHVPRLSRWALRRLAALLLPRESGSG